MKSYPLLTVIHLERNGNLDQAKTVGGILKERVLDLDSICQQAVMLLLYYRIHAVPTGTIMIQRRPMERTSISPTPSFADIFSSERVC